MSPSSLSEYLFRYFIWYEITDTLAMFRIASVFLAAVCLFVASVHWWSIVRSQ
ncbi:hypothetical protein ASPSYDRAFT_47907 [Aspergillus sydowii CBS 593.65]|uniref:Uncharacterized protein n=1 Tax=Aspergillus sydowii CBS 593.65 TaxID=1036612 RepID=A0A1L9TB10_9EURO|nr:uncharacterized protein ASPSYDRAFT_47907 [Aspergillus sydowii CBS 593.65]OJJ56619.1 hypothetical protein ASPSYDRAFT_47907 [Aspergillus sydowii CBS 593.65]